MSVATATYGIYRAVPATKTRIRLGPDGALGGAVIGLCIVPVVDDIHFGSSLVHNPFHDAVDVGAWLGRQRSERFVRLTSVLLI